MHTTNYSNTFIEIAEDCPVKAGEIPANKKEEKSIAILQYEMIKNNPYGYTSDDVIFGVFAQKNGIERSEAEKQRFFSKGQPCMRSSPLTKRYGWGVHSNSECKIAIFPVESEEYRKLKNDRSLQHLKAMRSKRA